MRKRTRFAPPSSHIFSTFSLEGVAEVLGKPPGTWSGENVHDWSYRDIAHLPQAEQKLW